MPTTTPLNATKPRYCLMGIKHDARKQIADAVCNLLRIRLCYKLFSESFLFCRALYYKMPNSLFYFLKEMLPISLEAARCLAAASALTSAEIRSLDGRKWIIVLHGNNDFVLKSDRQNPRRYGTLETAVAEIYQLGFYRCEVNLEQWMGREVRQAQSMFSNSSAIK